MGPEDTKDGVDLQLHAPFSALCGFGRSSPCPVSFTPRKGTGTHFTDKRVGSRSCMDRSGEERNLLSHRISNPELSSSQGISILTTLCRSHIQ